MYRAIRPASSFRRHGLLPVCYNARFSLIGMPENSRSKIIRVLSFALVGLGICTAVGLFFATRLYLLRTRVDHRPISWLVAIRTNLVTWYLWGLTACLVISLARRFPIGAANWRRRVPFHAVAGMTVALLHIAMLTIWYWAVEVPDRDPRNWWTMYKLQLMIGFHWDVITYAGLLSVTQAFDSERRARQREVRASQLEGLLANARLTNLRMQLHPHFLFNSLNAVIALLQECPSDAERVVVRLSELLRAALDQSDVQEIPLSEELDFARKYLETYSIRFGERLVVEWDVEPAVAAAYGAEPIITTLN